MKLLTPQQQEEIGRAVLLARSGGCPWKLLVSTYNRSREQLWRYARAVREKDVASPQMQHRETCGGAPAAA